MLSGDAWTTFLSQFVALTFEFTGHRVPGHEEYRQTRHGARLLQREIIARAYPEALYRT